MKNEFLIGLPRNRPEGLINELAISFSKIPRISSAYLALIYRHPFDEPPHLLLAVNMKGDLNEISSILGDVIKRNVVEGEYVEVCSLEIKEFAEYFSTIEPFYFRDNKTCPV